MKHELVQLAGKLEWDWVDGEIAPLYSDKRAREQRAVTSVTGRVTAEVVTGRDMLRASAVGFRRMITRLGKAAKMPFGVHPHMLRHACGYKLANQA
jgi:integrase